MGKLYASTVGVTLQVETTIDLTGASKVSLLVKKPSGAEAEWVGTPVGTTVQYVTQPNDLDEAGLYSIQVKAEFPDGSVFFGETVRLTVFEKYE